MGHPPISKIVQGFRFNPFLRNGADNTASDFKMQAK